MARVTIEDCVEKVKDRFELVALASHRAKAISSGDELTIESNNEKNTVLALREIAGSHISPEDLRQSLIKSWQKERSIEEETNLGSDEPGGAAVSDEINEEFSSEGEGSIEELEAIAEAAAQEESEIKSITPSSDVLSFEEDNLIVDD